MGSDQSAPAVARAQTSARLSRGNTVPITSVNKDTITGNSEAVPSGNTSPGASVCSDSDLPYISYTLNRPIGDSPKLSGRGQAASNTRRGITQKRSTVPRRVASLNSATAHNIVVVKEAKTPQSTDKDEDLLRLQQIPMFLPIMRGTLGLPGARDPEVLEGVDSSPWLRLCSRYQAHLTASAQLVSSEQNIITTRCKEIDAEVTKIHMNFVERQKQGAQIAEKLSHIKYVSQQLTRCHTLLEQLLISMDEINDILPSEHQLEPFNVSLD